ncbi:hypothetical protein XANCAGTX0491_000839 [Xanthoria calcicola]
MTWTHTSILQLDTDHVDVDHRNSDVQQRGPTFAVFLYPIWTGNPATASGPASSTASIVIAGSAGLRAREFGGPNMSLGNGGTPPTTEGPPANPDLGQTAINPTGLPGQPETPIEHVDLSVLLVSDDEEDPAGQRHRFHLPPREDGGDEAVALRAIIDACLGGIPRAPFGAVLTDGRSCEVFAEFLPGGDAVIPTFMV